MKSFSHGEASTNPTSSDCFPPLPKPEILDFEVPPKAICSKQPEAHAASSSQSSVRSSLIGMGFSPLLVDKAIEEHGENNVDLLLEILIENNNHQKPSSQSSDSLEALFDEKDESSPPDYTEVIQAKEEPEAFDAVDYDKRASLLMMNFSAKEIEFAIEKLGENAPIGDIVDFITAAQVATTLERETCSEPSGDAEKTEGNNEEMLYGTMDKTLGLLELGFSENEISLAVEALGSEVPISDLANWICAYQVGDEYIIKKEHSSDSFSIDPSQVARYHSYSTVITKTANCSRDAILQSRDMNVTRKGKRAKLGYLESGSDGQTSSIRSEDYYKGKRPKQECNDDSSSYDEASWLEEKVDPNITMVGLPKAFKPNSSRTLDKEVAKPPYFFYANIMNASFDVWGKISKFLYQIEPEFANTQFFSALSRGEGYIHNLPTENRFHILPKPPMSIEDAIPCAKKWWPLWDTRKQLSCIDFDPSGLPQLCDKLQRILIESQGLLSSEQKTDIFHKCQRSNLVWVGQNKLAPMEPEWLEQILGYPRNHTKTAEISSMERLHLLRYCLQTDTLGYHLSVLKSIYSGGITILSLFTGIGGAEVALHRIGIRLKAVVSVETSETKRKILKRWWQTSGQTGELEQIEDIEKLTSSRVVKLIDKFGGFDLVICQNLFPLSSKVPKLGPDRGNTLPSFDFSSFFEFVRVLKLVRGTMERRVT